MGLDSWIHTGTTVVLIVFAMGAGWASLRAENQRIRATLEEALRSLERRVERIERMIDRRAFARRDDERTTETPL